MTETNKFNMIIIGGGVTGAGVFYQSVFSGLKTILLEARDFSFGTSSRTGKLVHGGYRYLLNRQFAVSYHSVRERENLIKHSLGLVTRTPFIYLLQNSNNIDYLEKHFAMSLYHSFSSILGFKTYSKNEINQLLRLQGTQSERGGFSFSEGTTDDARLTLRLIFDGVQMGGIASNYSKVVKVLKNAKGSICGVVVQDESGNNPGNQYEILADVVINATGVWMDELCNQFGFKKRIRRQRGSHLILPRELIPLEHGLMFNHPLDKRIQFALPWYNTVIFGTTDIDENDSNIYENDEPGISSAEIEYLLISLKDIFPNIEMKPLDIISSFCGLRPIIMTDALHRSFSSRKHKIWDDNGMISISGGKLTTFQLMAYDALKKSAKYIKRTINNSSKYAFLRQPTDRKLIYHNPKNPFPPPYSRYGLKLNEYFEIISNEPEKLIEGTPYSWGDVRWALKKEMVVHLDDVFLRRTRIGLMLKNGGIEEIIKYKEEIMRELSWNEDAWDFEVDRYKNIIERNYSVKNM